MSAERASSDDPIVCEVRESREGRGEEIGQERERHAAARTPPAPRLLLLLSNDAGAAPPASALADSSFPSSSPRFFLFCFPAGRAPIRVLTTAPARATGRLRISREMLLLFVCVSHACLSIPIRHE